MKQNETWRGSWTVHATWAYLSHSRAWRKKKWLSKEKNHQTMRRSSYTELFLCCLHIQISFTIKYSRHVSDSFKPAGGCACPQSWQSYSTSGTSVSKQRSCSLTWVFVRDRSVLYWREKLPSSLFQHLFPLIFWLLCFEDNASYAKILVLTKCITELHAFMNICVIHETYP